MPGERSRAPGPGMAVLGPGRRRGVARRLPRPDSRPPQSWALARPGAWHGATWWRRRGSATPGRVPGLRAGGARGSPAVTPVPVSGASRRACTACCAVPGGPRAVAVLAGHPAAPAPRASPVARLCPHIGRARVALGGRGLLPPACIREARLAAPAEGLTASAAAGRAGPRKGAARRDHRGGHAAHRRPGGKHFASTSTDPSCPWCRQQRSDRAARFAGVSIVHPRQEDLAPAAAVEADQRLGGAPARTPPERGLHRGARPQPRVPVQAGLACGRAAAPAPGTAALRGPGPGGGPPPALATRGAGSARAGSQAQGGAPAEPPDGLPPGHSCRPLSDELASGGNVIRLLGASTQRPTVVTQPTRWQSRAGQLLAVKPHPSVPINRTG